MVCHATRRVRAAIIAVLLAVLAHPVTAQTLRSVVEPNSRVFPAVGPGVTALKRDASGRYYVLARPATVVSIYDSGGKLIGQIPNANSRDARIRYAVDIDLSSDGLLFVADRGANAVEVFNPDGSIASKISVLAPTSVVALRGGLFAVTTLTSEHLIQIMDEKGNQVRTFGDATDDVLEEEEDSGKKPLTDWGRIVGNSGGDIYFAFKTPSEPILRKYDLYGYVGYEASVPRDIFEDRVVARTDRVEFKLNVTHLSLSDETNGWFSIGSSGDVKFGSGMGTGLSRVLGSGGSFGRAAAQISMWQPGSANSPGGMAGGSIGGTFSAQVTDQGTNFQLGAGNISSMRGGGRGRFAGASASSSADQAATLGTPLQFFGAGNDSTDQFTSALAFSATASESDGAISADSGDQTNASANIGLDPSLPAAFAYATIFNATTFGGQPPGTPGGMSGRFPGGGMRFARTGFADSGARFGDGHFGPHGRFGAGEGDVTATLRVNLGDLGGNSAGERFIRATAVDPATGELWAAVGDTLIHFSQSGTPTEVYYLATKGGVPLQPSALLIEPDRFLIAADPWGIFEFPRTR
jgi:hypothetical protein